MVKTILAFSRLDGLKPDNLEALSNKFQIVKLYREADPDQTIRQHASNTVAIICQPGQKISCTLIENLPNLEIISSNGVGFDHIDLDAAKQRGIVVCNTPDLVTNDTADTAIALMLMTARRFVEADAYVRIGKWESDGDIGLGHRLGGKTVGIVGLGRIGSAIAHRAEAFGCEIKYTGRGEKETPYTFISDLKKLAQESDFLVLSCAATPETKGMIDLDIMEALGADGYLINVSRGSVVNEGDLLIALRNKTIKGAGLDVFENEPHVPGAMKTMDNVVVLPHVGTATFETRMEMAHLVIENIKRWFESGETLTRIV